MKYHLYSLKVSGNVKIAMYCFEIFWGKIAPKATCAPSVRW